MGRHHRNIGGILVNPQQKSITAAFAIIFVIIGAKHGWLDDIILWAKNAAGAPLPKAVG